jgi:hypothetical protein
MTYILTRYPIRLMLSFLLMILLFLNLGTLLAQSVSIDSPDTTTQNATQYELFTLDIVISGGVSPYETSATNLPSGFSVVIDDDGNGASIEGVTAVTGTFTVTVSISDSNPDSAATDDVTFDIDVAAVAADTIEIDVPDVFELTEGTVGETYPTVQFSTTDDAIESCYQWSASSGDLPSGMAVSSGDGTLIGTPTESGEFDFTMIATDDSCDYDDDDNNVKADGARDYRVTVAGSSGSGDLEISSPTSSNLPSGVLGRSYSVDVDATGGDGSYVFTATGLPGGLNINSSTGTIVGTPTASGSFNVKVTVEDGNEDTASRSYTLTISETGDAEYDSAPSPGVTLDFGNVNVGATFTINLLVSEEGTDQLDVSQPSGGLIQGPEASYFSIVSNSPPFSIDDGGDDVLVQIRCAPDAAGDYDAFLQFVTNDEDIPTVVYSLYCVGVTSGGSEDPDTTTDGTGTTDGSTATPSIPTQTPLPPTYANVVEVQGLSLRTGPFIGASRRGILRPDINYRVTAKNNQEGVYMWYYIVLDDGETEGWASGRYLAVYGQDVSFAGSVLDNVWNERDYGVKIKALDNLHFRPAPSDRTQPYVDLIPWGGIMTLYARTASGRGDEWYAVEYNGIYGWVYAPVTQVVEGLIELIPKY